MELLIEKFDKDYKKIKDKFELNKKYYYSNINNNKA